MMLDTCQRCGGDVGTVYGAATCFQCGHSPGGGLPAPKKPMGGLQRTGGADLFDPAMVTAQLSGWPVETLEDLRTLENAPQLPFPNMRTDTRGPERP